VPVKSRSWTFNTSDLALTLGRSERLLDYQGIF